MSLSIDIQKTRVRTFSELGVNDTFRASGKIYMKSSLDLVAWLEEFGNPSIPIEAGDLWLPLGSTTSASSEVIGYEASKAVDSDRLTSWLVESSDIPAYLDIDLGQVIDADQLVLYDSLGSIKDWEISYYNGSNWVVVKEGSGIANGEPINFTKVSTQLLRFKIVNLQYMGLSGIREIGLESKSFKVPPYTSVVATSYEGSNAPENCLDNVIDLDTFWETANANLPANLTITFPEEYSFDSFRIADKLSNVTNWQLEYWNGTGFSNAITGTSITDLEEVSFSQSFSSNIWRLKILSVDLNSGPMSEPAILSGTESGPFDFIEDTNDRFRIDANNGTPILVTLDSGIGITLSQVAVDLQTKLDTEFGSRTVTVESANNVLRLTTVLKGSSSEIEIMAIAPIPGTPASSSYEGVAYIADNVGLDGNTISLTFNGVKANSLGSGNIAGILFEADNPGTVGNAIALSFDGAIDTLDSVVSDWNTANPSNTVSHNGTGSTIPDFQTVNLSSGSGQSIADILLAWNTSNPTKTVSSNAPDTSVVPLVGVVNLMGGLNINEDSYSDLGFTPGTIVNGIEGAPESANVEGTVVETYDIISGRNDQLKLNIDSQGEVLITLASGTSLTAAQVASDLQSKLNIVYGGVYADVTSSAGVFSITSRTSGLSSTVEIVDITSTPALPAEGSHEGVTYTADTAGTVGNAIVITFTGSNTIDSAVSDWNTANPSNTVSHNAPDGAVIPLATTLGLAGGDEAKDVHAYSILGFIPGIYTGVDGIPIKAQIPVLQFHETLEHPATLPDLSSFRTTANAFNISDNKLSYFDPECVVEFLPTKLIVLECSETSFS